jgi:hypothetical protein
MDQWSLALRVFIFGFSGVFVTLAILMISILISGTIVRTRNKDDN